MYMCNSEQAHIQTHTHTHKMYWNPTGYCIILAQWANMSCNCWWEKNFWTRRMFVFSEWSKKEEDMKKKYFYSYRNRNFLMNPQSVCWLVDWFVGGASVCEEKKKKDYKPRLTIVKRMRRELWVGWRKVETKGGGNNWLVSANGGLSPRDNNSRTRPIAAENGNNGPDCRPIGEQNWTGVNQSDASCRTIVFRCNIRGNTGLDARKVSLARTQQLLLVAKLLQNHRVSVIYGEKPSLRGESK